MLIDFNSLDMQEIPHMNNGEGAVCAKMVVNEIGRFIECRVQPGSSIGTHEQNSGHDISFIISGQGHAICNGTREELKPGTCHIAPKEATHSIVNDGDEDLVLLTVVI